jgi:hypothetical protein
MNLQVFQYPEHVTDAAGVATLLCDESAAGAHRIAEFLDFLVSSVASARKFEAFSILSVPTTPFSFPVATPACVMSAVSAMVGRAQGRPLQADVQQFENTLAEYRLLFHSLQRGQAPA